MQHDSWKGTERTVGGTSVQNTRLVTTHVFQILAFNFELIYNSDRSVLMPQSERLHNHCGLGECAFRCVALNSRVVGGGAGGEGGLTPL